MLGITSVIRDPARDPALYSSMGHFFRADSWEREGIFIAWIQAISSRAPLKWIAGRAVLAGDGVKRASDGRYMPCTKKMVQESESASKAFCLPLSIQIHDGDGAISDWLGIESVSHVVQMLRDGFRAARYIGMFLLS